MAFPWWLGGGLLGLLRQWFFKVWDKIDDPTKKLIIESVVKAFQEILRAFYKWWQQRGGKL
ncbi:hypothetical protein H6F86_24375 [Phormidium sp. FACHB-592]|uniref:Uncharacterized protein n=1 Tax=Stenomitos frigidus AS-A4 TaxID=2933935 RepID=A0ABV0KKC1_9CYAN|nr:hypothetical protein [Phormidium sp. FACHB-592]MBD2076964.1 hypothetical protein [Phormidium sp. FACHB-592]